VAGRCQRSSQTGRTGFQEWKYLGAESLKPTVCPVLARTESRNYARIFDTPPSNQRLWPRFSWLAALQTPKVEKIVFF